MLSVLSRLQNDHRRMRNVLNALKNAAEELTLPVTEHELDALYCLVSYMADYPDQVHHPLEDRVCALLVDQSGDTNVLPINVLSIDVQQALKEQHTHLAECTQSLLKRLTDLDTPGQLDFLRRDLQHYLDLQLQHMTFEEQHVFPLIGDVVDGHDLDELTTAVDPLFDQLDRRFHSIYKYLEVDPMETAQVQLAEPLYRYLGATGLSLTPMD